MKYIPKPFEIAFFHYKSHNWNDKKLLLKNLIQSNVHEFQNKDKLGLTKNNTTFFNTNLINNFSKIFYEEIKAFSKESLIELDLCNEKSSAWFQIYNESENHSIHNHGLGISCICFINFVKDVHRPPVFLAPFNSFINSSWLQFEPDVEEGDVLFFPSPILHFVPPNTSKVSRIIGAMNLSIINKNNNWY